jgi:hypothetical protein
MNGTLAVLRRDYKEMRATAAFRIMIAVVAAVILIASVAITIALRRQSWYGVPAAAPVAELGVALVAYFLPLFVLLAFIWAFAGLPVIKEKVNGNIECLMATPLSPRALWLGKGLAVFLPAYVMALGATAGVLLVWNVAVFLPGWGALVLTPAALLNGLIVNPLLFLSMLMFILLISLAGNPDVAITPSFLIGFGLMIGIPAALATGKIDISSWTFVLWYLAATVAAWVVVLPLTRLLRRQNIVLSSKGS